MTRILKLSIEQRRTVFEQASLHSGIQTIPWPEKFKFLYLLELLQLRVLAIRHNGKWVLRNVSLKQSDKNKTHSLEASG
jgi:hypothetical protein